MVKVDRLRGIIVEKGTTQESIADIIGLNRSTFYRKMKKQGDFSLKEAKAIKSALGLSNQEAIDIFFAEWVAFMLLNANKPHRKGDENEELYKNTPPASYRGNSRKRKL